MPFQPEVIQINLMYLNNCGTTAIEILKLILGTRDIKCWAQNIGKISKKYFFLKTKQKFLESFLK